MSLLGYDEELDFTKLKYALYVRKSTEDETRQVKSIPDQIEECLSLASRLGLRIVGKPIVETKSAKTPNKRPIFRKMLEDIKSGVYDGILAWNPDRLARNMLEGGEIINMIDEGIIKDLKFVTHHFTKDANGKMLLGMAFVLSKQYSDKLSQDVTRGVQSDLAEGKSPIPKYGYVRDESGLYRPDDRNHELICDAWSMRVKGDSIEVITKYLNEQGFYREIKSSAKKTFMTKQKLSDMFKDSFYYGMLQQAQQTVDLRLVQTDFVPATTQDDFLIIQQMTYRRIKPSIPHRDTFYPFRLMIFCLFCNQSMRVAPTTSGTKGKRYLYARCDTKGCERKKKSIRVKVIIDFVSGLLKDGLNFTEKEYQQYLDGMKYLSDDHKIAIRGELNTKRGLFKLKDRELSELSRAIAKIAPESVIYRKNAEYIATLDTDCKTLTKEIDELEVELKKSEGEVMTLEEFANLSKNAVITIQSADAVGKDIICRQIFANWAVDESKVASYQLKEPFATLIEQRQILFSRGAGN